MKYDKCNKTAHSLTWLMCVIHSYMKHHSLIHETEF